jgi:hypothetical protein
MIIFTDFRPLQNIVITFLLPVIKVAKNIQLAKTTAAKMNEINSSSNVSLYAMR